MAKTDIIAIVDRSGSMAWGWEETKQSFINFMKEQKKMPGEATFTLTFFNENVETLFICKPLEAVSEKYLNDIFTDYSPNGGTALNDAICQTILSYDEVRADADGRMVLIVTDGEENSSERYSSRDVNNIREVKEKTVKNWEFIFMGKSEAQAKNYGIKHDNTIVFNKLSSDTMNQSYGLANSTLYATRMCYNNKFDTDKAVDSSFKTSGE